MHGGHLGFSRQVIDLQEPREEEHSVLHWLSMALVLHGGDLSCDGLHLTSSCVLVEFMLQRIQNSRTCRTIDACLAPCCGQDLDYVDALLESTGGRRTLVTFSHVYAWGKDGIGAQGCSWAGCAHIVCTWTTPEAAFLLAMTSTS